MKWPYWQNAALHLPRRPSPDSRQHALDDVAVHIGQATVEAVVVVGQRGVVEAEQVEDGGVEVPHGHPVYRGTTTALPSRQ